MSPLSEQPFALAALSEDQYSYYFQALHHSESSLEPTSPQPAVGNLEPFPASVPDTAHNVMPAAPDVYGFFEPLEPSGHAPLVAVPGLFESPAESGGQQLEHAAPIVEPPAERPVVPTSSADWEVRKHIIQDLYMDRNLILNEVIDIMLKKHNFKATARMYKGQFAKWRWTKYNKSGNAGSMKPTKARTAAKKKCADVSEVGGASPIHHHHHHHHQRQTQLPLRRPSYTQLIRLLQFNDADREMQVTLAAYGALISHWSERETPWKAAFTCTSTSTATGAVPGSLDGALVWKPLGQKNSILQQVRASLEHFRRNRPDRGGEVLRQAFLEIEHALAEGLDLEAVWDCCLAVPQLIWSEGWTDMLSIFAGYLHQLASIRLPGHPIARVAQGLHGLAATQHQDRDAACRLLRLYVARGWEIWIDRVTAVRGPQDDVTVHLKRGYITLVNPDPAMTERLVPDFCQAVRRSLARRGAFATTSRMLELEHLLVRMYLPLFTPEASARTNRMLTALIGRIEGCDGGGGGGDDADPRSSNNNKNRNRVETRAPSRTDWHFLDRYLVFSANYFLAAVAEYNGEAARAAAYRRRSLDTPRDLFWLQTALATEQRLRLAGYHDEANDIMDERLKVQNPIPPPAQRGTQEV